MEPLREGYQVAWHGWNVRYEGVVMLCEGDWDFFEMASFCLVKEKLLGTLYYISVAQIETVPEEMKATSRGWFQESSDEGTGE